MNTTWHAVSEQQPKITLPAWILNLELGDTLAADPEGKMRIALTVLERQIDAKTGGPFAALVYDLETHRLVSVGVNRVIPCNDPTAHAEIVATRYATTAAKNFQFSGQFGMVTTAQMCGMCCTHMLWAGYGEVIIGARASDTEGITGFDEGVIAPDWKEQLEARGVRVITDICREQVCEQFHRYVEKGGFIYNGATRQKPLQ